MKLSVVITCYREGPLLLEAVESAVGQVPAPHEVLVVRDAGDDSATDAACAEAERRFGTRVIRRAVNGGTSAARNTGFSAATGDVIVPLDADDLLPAGALKAISAVLQANPKAEFVSGPYWLLPADGPRRLVSAAPTELRALLAPVHGSFSTAWDLLGTSPLKKELWQRIGGYDESYGVADLHDVEFWIRALKAARGAARTETPLYTWRRALGANTARVSAESWGRLAARHYERYREVGLEYRARELLLLSHAVQTNRLGALTERWALLQLSARGRARPLSLVAAATPSVIIRGMARRLRRK